MRAKTSSPPAEVTYTILLQPEPEGGFTVTCPALPGLVTYGESREDARVQATEAIAAYLESLAKDGEPAPEGEAGERPPSAEHIRIKLPA